MLPEGSLAWVPASATQLVYNVPEDYLASLSGKPAFLPVMVKKYEGETGTYVLEWDHAVNIKCNASEAFPRVPFMDSANSQQLSLVDELNDASILEAVWQNFQRSQLVTFAGKVRIFVNPLRKVSSCSRVNMLRLVNDIRHQMLDSGKSQSLLFRGCSGSGKTEMMKSALHMLLQQDCGVDPAIISNSQTSNLFQTGDFSHIAKCLAASVCLLDSMTAAPSFKNKTGTRYLNQISVCFAGGDRIGSVEILAHSLEPFHCGLKDPMARPYQIFSQLTAFLANDSSRQVSTGIREALLQDYDPDSCAAMGQSFELLTELLLDSGEVSPDLWESCINALVACLHLQSVTIVGADTAIISSGTKNSVSHAELALGVEAGSIANLLLKKTEEKMGRTIVTDNKLADAKAVQETLCAEIYRRVLDLLLALLSKGSAESGPVSAASQQQLIFLDTPGWELQESLSAIHGFPTFISNYVDEKLSALFIDRLFVKEMKFFTDEGIHPPQILPPDLNPIIELFDKAPSGLLCLLEETSQFPRGDDKTFAEKSVSTHAKGRLVRNAGTKAKPTTFIIRHSFGDVAYDVSGFIATNKGRLSTSSVQVLASSVLPCMTHEFHTPPSRSDDPRVKAERIMAKKGFLGNRSKERLGLLLGAIDETTTPTFALCLRPNLDNEPNKFNPEYVLRQIHHLCLTDVVRLTHEGFIFNSPWREFYNRFRVIAPLFDTSFPPNSTGLTDVTAAAACRKLIELITSLLLAEGNSKDIVPPVFGPSRIFVKDRYFVAVERLRAMSIARLYKAAGLIQAMGRMRILFRRYNLVRRGVLSAQSFVRMHFDRSVFVRQRLCANKIKATFLMQRCSKRYRTLRNAAIFIKDRLFSGLLTRLRFLRLQRAVRRTQCLARSLIIRNIANTVQLSIFCIQRNVRIFLRRQAVARLRKHSAISVQRVFRGWIFREKNAAIAYALAVRRNQRIVKRVVRILQSIWRRKLVQRRFVTVLLATTVLQRWARARLQRFWFLAAHAVAQWLQKHARRIGAVNRVDRIRCLAMLLEEIKRLEDLRKSELKYLQEEPYQDCNSIEKLSVGAGAVRVGKASFKFSRRVIGLGLEFDVSEAYPNGWLRSVTEFNSKLKSMNKSMTKIAFGSLHTVLVDDANNVYTFGMGDLGQLGHNVRRNESFPRKVECVETSIRSAESAFLLDSPSFAKQSVPRQVGHAVRVLDVCCGRDHTLLLMESRRVYSWGGNRRGQLGHSNFSSSAVPRPVAGPNNKNIIQVSCGAAHCAALNSAGILYTWGAGFALGGRGGGTNERIVGEDSCEALSIPFFIKRKVQFVACGDVHVIVKSNSDLLSWGQNKYGQLGDGTRSDRLEPGKVRLPLMLKESEMEAAILASGGRHVAFLVGDLYSWGWNEQGQVGVGGIDDVLLPTKITLEAAQDTGEHSFRSESVQLLDVYPAWNSTAALARGGRIYFWGKNSFLQTVDKVPATRRKSLVATTRRSCLDSETASLLDKSAVQLHLPCSSNDSSGNVPLVISAPVEVDLPTNVLSETHRCVNVHSATMSVLMVDSLLPSEEKSKNQQLKIQIPSPRGGSPRSAFSSTKVVVEKKDVIQFRDKLGKLEVANRPKASLESEADENSTTMNESPTSNNKPQSRCCRNEGELTTDGLLTIFSPFPGRSPRGSTAVEMFQRGSQSSPSGTATGFHETLRSGIGMPLSEKIVSKLSRQQKPDDVVIPALGIGVELDSAAKALKAEQMQKEIRFNAGKRRGSVLTAGKKSKGASEKSSQWTASSMDLALPVSESSPASFQPRSSAGRRSSMPGLAQGQQPDVRRIVADASKAPSRKFAKPERSASPTPELDELDAAMESLRKDLDARASTSRKIVGASVEGSPVEKNQQEGFDLGRVRDLAAMIQIIKKESLVQSSSWKY